MIPLILTDYREKAGDYAGRLQFFRYFREILEFQNFKKQVSKFHSKLDLQLLITEQRLLHHPNGGSIEKAMIDTRIRVWFRNA